jgi:hypothetical protein
MTVFRQPYGDNPIIRMIKKGEVTMDRQAFIEKLNARLKQWDAEMDKLEARAQEAKADARIKYERRLAEVREKKTTAQRRLEEVKQSSENAWQELKKGAENAFDEVKQAFESARSKFE